MARGTGQQNKKYCTKSSTRLSGPWETGDVGACGQGTRNDLRDVWNAIKDGKSDRDIGEMHPGALLRYHGGIKAARYALEHEGVQKRTTKTPVYVIFGPPGIGKGRWCEQEITTRGWDAYWLKPKDSDWWDQYNGTQPILFDDFTGTIRYDLWLNLCDERDINVKMTGRGSVGINPQALFFTSNRRPAQWWSSKVGVDMRAVNRRVTKWVVCGGEAHAWASEVFEKVEEWEEAVFRLGY